MTISPRKTKMLTFKENDILVSLVHLFARFCVGFLCQDTGDENCYTLLSYIIYVCLNTTNAVVEFCKCGLAQILIVFIKDRKRAE